MAISKDKKSTLVADLTALLNDAQATVFARYQGLTVAELQDLRAAARENGVKIKEGTKSAKYTSLLET